MARAALASIAILLIGSCVSSSECTEIGCDHEAVVTFPAGLVVGPYDLILDPSMGTPIAARCNDPEAPEAADNPPELECNSAGFTLVGGSGANSRTMRVTIVLVQTDEEVSAGTEVFLDVVDERTPNGDGCEPTCFTRNGQLVLPPPG